MLKLMVLKVLLLVGKNLNIKLNYLVLDLNLRLSDIFGYFATISSLGKAHTQV